MHCQVLKPDHKSSASATSKGKSAHRKDVKDNLNTTDDFKQQVMAATSEEPSPIKGGHVRELKNALSKQVSVQHSGGGSSLKRGETISLVTSKTCGNSTVRFARARGDYCSCG